MDMGHLLKSVSEQKGLYKLLQYMEPREILSDLLISPDSYECVNIYSCIYDNFGGDFTDVEFSMVTDSIDSLYETVVGVITSALKNKHADKSYALDRWISPTAALIGSIAKTD